MYSGPTATGALVPPKGATPASAELPKHARLPFVHSCTADAAVQEDLRRADGRQERAARNLAQSFAFGAPGVGGGHRHARRVAIHA
jgi:hypothetical protein